MKPRDPMVVGIVAPSAAVPQVELSIGVERLREEGFEVRVHPQCRKRHLFFAGTDDERAAAFLEYAEDPSIDVIWCARGGYGAFRTAQRLEELRPGALRSAAPKLLVGFSDATLLLEYVRQRWGWSSLHAPMPAVRDFSLISKKDWAAVVGLIRRSTQQIPNHQLKFISNPPEQEVRGTLVGGNLTVWVASAGTPFESSSQGKILFFEDVGEGLYRLDRCVHQLIASGGLEEAKAIVLGTFEQCEDVVNPVLRQKPQPRHQRATLSKPKPKQLKPLRPKISSSKGLIEIFAPIGERYPIPIAIGLKVGHGSENFPLPLGAEYTISPQGQLSLVDWQWLRMDNKTRIG